ncbi:MAG: UDP-glucose 4-epimerase GalE [Magnetospirillum sp.]|nr:MAG: UDP-glucose 4-epimerase GalE [Magnetospirillum sp.]
MGMTVVLVTGGAGYIGSHACKALAAHGFTPVTYDSLIHGHREVVKWGPLEVGDVGDADLLQAVVRRWKPEAVMHFAGLIAVGESVREPAAYYRANVAASITLLDVMRYAGITSIVFSSSAAVYGAPERLPVAEDAPLLPTSPYGRSKLMVEQMLADHAAAYGLKWAALRYFNACGADPGGETGEDHQPETHLIPRALMAAAGDIPYLDLFGTDYPTEDGTCVRDYVHVSDLAEMHVAALAHLSAGRRSGAFNLGTGRGWSNRQIIAAVERVTRGRVALKLAGRRPGDPPVLVADPRRAEAELRVSARHTDLDAIVESAWSWYRRHRR